MQANFLFADLVFPLRASYHIVVVVVVVLELWKHFGNLTNHHLSALIFKAIVKDFAWLQF